MHRCLFVLLLILPGLAPAADPGACLDCHQAQASRGLAPLLEGQHAEYLGIQLTRFRDHLRAGFPMRDLAQGLDDALIEGLAAELAGRDWPAQRARLDPEAVARGEALAGQRDCAACHGEGMLGGGSIPRLAGQAPAYLRGQLEAFSRFDRHHPPTGGGQRMQALSSEQSDELAQWLASLGVAKAPPASR